MGSLFDFLGGSPTVPATVATPPVAPAVEVADETPLRSVNEMRGEMSDGALAVVSHPHDFPEPCEWCGGRYRHSESCEELHDAWSLPMIFKKHRGTPICRVPSGYLRWAMPKIDKVDLADEIRRVLASRSVKPPARQLPPPPLDRIAGRGESDRPCACGSTDYVDVKISGNRLRRDCQNCGAFITFSKWYEESNDAGL